MLALPREMPIRQPANPPTRQLASVPYDELQDDFRFLHISTLILTLLQH